MRALALLCALAGLARADLQSLASPGPLAEGHKQLEGQCDKCHVPFKGIPSSACLHCHSATKERIVANRGPHARFEREGKKCSSCHRNHKGRGAPMTPPVPQSNFDHAKETGVVLAGKHAGVACSGCHKPGPTKAPRWVGLPRDADCLGCHADVHKGTLGPDCARCHTPATWKPPTRSLADHKLSMEGGHKGLPCATCHPKGAHLTKESSCGDCHQQNHGGTKAPCATCHNVSDWHTATFKHDFCTCFLPGKHQTAPCLACHPAFRFNPTPLTCQGCHKKDRKHEELGPCAQCHSALSWKTKAFDHNSARVGFKIEGRHTEVGCENCHKQKGIFKNAPRACEGCHKTPAHGDFGACAKCHSTFGFDKPTFDHGKTAFPLDGKHEKATCQGCHAKFKKGQLQPGADACKLCHSDPHQGQFGALKAPLLLADAGKGAHAVSPRLGCRDCHSTQTWAPSTVTATRHADFAFPLRGAHASVACELCHDAGRFLGTPQRCNACHLDRHRGRLGRDCESCHEEASWKKHPRFDHQAATGFALAGAHGGVACERCHGADHAKLAQAASPVGCATCHTPTHGDEFGRQCDKCHKPSRWKDTPPFDHAATMFPLDRRHRAVPCASCHTRAPVGAVSSSAGRDFARPVRIDPACRTCHGDPHRGRTQLDCEDCHRADVWSLVRFDHDRTIFPLRGRHFTVPCRDCHVADQFTGVRPECVSCHRGDRVRADSLHLDHRSFSPDCSECHRPFKW